MAPKKKRIKVEQELQGSCSHRATPPPSKPEAMVTRRRNQKKPTCTLPLLQKSAELYTPFAPFVRLVKEITESCPSQVKRWTPEALLCLQDAADYYLNETFFVDLQLAIHPICASSNLGPQPAYLLSVQAISEDKPTMEFEIEKMFRAFTHQVVKKVLHGLDVATLKVPERCAALQLASTSLPGNFASISNIKAMLDKLVAISQQLQLPYSEFEASPEQVDQAVCEVKKVLSVKKNTLQVTAQKIISIAKKKADISEEVVKLNLAFEELNEEEEQLLNIQSVQDLEVKAQEQALCDATAKANMRANEKLQAKRIVLVQEAEKIFTNLNQFLSQDN